MNTPAERAATLILDNCIEVTGLKTIKFVFKSGLAASFIQQAIDEATAELRAELEQTRADAAKLLIGQIDAAVGDLWTKEGKE